MRNYDEDGPRAERLRQDFTFQLCGESVELRHGLKVGSTALDSWLPVLARMQTPLEERSAPDYKKVQDDEFVAVWLETMVELSVPGSLAALERILANDQVPAMIRDLVDVLVDSVNVVMGNRPTEASSGSSAGSTAPTPEPAEPSSPAASSSPEAGASPTSP